MKLSEHVANYVFEKLTSLKEGATIEDVKIALDGLDSKLQGLSDKEKVSLFEDTPTLKSFTDGRVSSALSKKESDLTSKFETERQNYQKTIDELRAMTPEKDVETLKKEWLEASEKDKETAKQKYEYAKLKADLDSMKKEVEQAKLNEKKAKLKEIAISEFGDRKLPKFFNLDSYLGADEEETKEKVKLGIAEYDEFMKTIKASSVDDTTPSVDDESPEDITAAMSAVGSF
jgi:superfamily I DNA/RNA helicase